MVVVDCGVLTRDILHHTPPTCPPTKETLPQPSSPSRNSSPPSSRPSSISASRSTTPRARPSRSWASPTTSTARSRSSSRWPPPTPTPSSPPTWWPTSTTAATPTSTPGSLWRWSASCPSTAPARWPPCNTSKQCCGRPWSRSGGRSSREALWSPRVRPGGKDKTHPPFALVFPFRHLVSLPPPLISILISLQSCYQIICHHTLPVSPQPFYLNPYNPRP